MNILNFMQKYIPILIEVIFAQFLGGIIDVVKRIVNKFRGGDLKKIEKGKFEFAFTTSGYEYWDKNVSVNGDYLLDKTGLPIRNLGEVGVDIVHMDVFVNGNQTRNMDYNDGDHYSTGEINSTKNVNLNLSENDKKQNRLNVVILLTMESEGNRYVQEMIINFHRKDDEDIWRRISYNTDVFFKESKLKSERERILAFKV